MHDFAIGKTVGEPRGPSIVRGGRGVGGCTVGLLGAIFTRIATLDDLPGDIAPHMLRHCFASLAADLGFNEPTIASLLGHKNVQRYQQLRFHSAVLAAADALTNETLKVMGGTGFGNSVPAFGSATTAIDQTIA